MSTGKLRPQNVLLLRTDRIGDVILSTPVALALKKAHPDSQITFLVRRATLPIVQSCPAVDAAIPIEMFMQGGRLQLRALVRYLKQQRFNAAVHLFPRPALTLATFLARIPHRIGTGYRYYSLLFNHRIYEHRKTAERHEAEYNLQLLRPFGIEAPEVAFSLTISDEAWRKIDQLLADAGIGTEEPLVVLHPGSGGSARDWPPEHFAELAQRLIEKEQARVAITGAPNEQPLADAILQRMKVKPLALVGRLTLQELAALLRRADVFVANSTGPLHLAVAVGTEVVAFYPPILACRPERWGPYGHRQDVLMSQQEECFRCRKRSERWCECMYRIPVQAALDKIAEKLAQKVG
ncbi:MAG: glycosyltransferase family 9 protein [candidate division KSB1 bacterium]|nr:glycosyltransferase family 9 protein [candidate division KSB1 bacterium]